MIITVASYKGGVGKTTTAVHLAAYLQELAPTLLLDGDVTRNASAWCQRGENKWIPFRVAPIGQSTKLAREKRYTHFVIDLGQRPENDTLAEASEACDLLVVPTVPSALDTDGLGQTIRALAEIRAANYKVLLTRVAPDAARQALDVRELLADFGAPVFRAEIPRLKAFDKAAGTGQIVRDTHDAQAERAWAAYVAVGKELGL
jgi:chromosome partitioning protein